MAESDFHTLAQVVTLAKEAGLEFLRWGDIEVRFPAPVPAKETPEHVPAAQRGTVEGNPARSSDYSRLFGGQMPSFQIAK